MPVKPVPEGYTTLSPYLVVDGAAQAIDYYQRVFGATERGRFDGPDGKVAHAELRIGDTVMMVADPSAESNIKAPTQLGATSVGIFLYVEDVDATVQRAVDAGATITQPVDDMFWGDRYGKVTDPFGHEWLIATHIEDVSPEEMAERVKEAMAGAG
jgi:PhnB protein